MILSTIRYKIVYINHFNKIYFVQNEKKNRQTFREKLIKFKKYDFSSFENVAAFVYLFYARFFYFSRFIFDSFSFFFIPRCCGRSDVNHDF